MSPSFHHMENKQQFSLKLTHNISLSIGKFPNIETTGKRTTVKVFPFHTGGFFEGAFLWAYSGIGMVEISQTIVRSRATLIPEWL